MTRAKSELRPERIRADRKSNLSIPRNHADQIAAVTNAAAAPANGASKKANGKFGGV